MKKRQLYKYPSWHLLLIIILGVLVGGVQADPIEGVISATSSVIGMSTGDRIGSDGVTELPTGNIVIISPNWSGGMGAVTCLMPAEYRTGNIIVSGANSLVGSATTHSVGSGGITVLENGNYVVRSPLWDNGATGDVGAATWVNGTTCIPANEGV